MDRQALLIILHDARTYNEIHDITGVLLHDSRRFLQLIEGPKGAVTDLLSRLLGDARHEDFHIHQDINTQVRLFPDWEMGFGDLQAPELAFLLGIVSQSEQQGRLFLLVDRLPELAQRLQLALAEVG